MVIQADNCFACCAIGPLGASTTPGSSKKYVGTYRLPTYQQYEIFWTEAQTFLARISSSGLFLSYLRHFLHGKKVASVDTQIMSAVRTNFAFILNGHTSLPFVYEWELKLSQLYIGAAIHGLMIEVDPCFEAAIITHNRRNQHHRAGTRFGRLLSTRASGIWTTDCEVFPSGEI